MRRTISPDSTSMPMTKPPPTTAVDPEASSSRRANTASPAATTAEPIAVAESAIHFRRRRRAGVSGTRSDSSWVRIACWSAWSSGRARARARAPSPPRVCVRLERLGLAAAAVEREHELRAESLAKRLCANERRELADELRALTASEICVDPRLEGGEALLVQRVRSVRRERLAREVGERRSAPERKSAPKSLRGRLGRTVELATAELDERAEALEVELLRRDLEGVAGGLRDERSVWLEGFAKS